MITVQQQYASAVYERIDAFKNENLESTGGEDAIKRYGSMAIKLPYLVQKSGLVQALVFIQMKAFTDSGKPYRILLNDLAAVVMGEEDEQHQMNQFLEASRTSDVQDYIYLTHRTMLALEWFKRFSQSILKVEITDEGEGG